MPLERLYLWLLIALQINNWNEENSNEKIVQEYLLKIALNVVTPDSFGFIHQQPLKRHKAQINPSK